MDSDKKELRIAEANRKLDGKDDVADIVEAIEECDGITSLSLGGNTFGVDAARAIAEVLAQKPTLKKAFWNNMFVSRGKTDIPPALSALGESVINSQAQLVELDLSDNAFGPAGVESIRTLLTSPACFTLKALRFNNNGLGIGGGKILSKALLQCHEEAQKEGQRLALEVFVAGRNRLEDKGATALAEVFETLCSLVEVSLPQNGIGAVGVAALAKAFSKNQNMQVIDLNDNSFTEEGSQAMAEALPNLQELRVLNFGDCLVRSDGAEAIAEAVKSNHRLIEELDLGFCELNVDAGIKVARALAGKRNLRKLDLNGNSFGESGIEQIREIMEAGECGEALGSFSDDEDVDNEDEEEEEEEGGEREEGEGGEGKREGEGGEEDDGDNSNEERETKTENDHSHFSLPKLEEPVNHVTVEEYLSVPTGTRLLALGPERTRLIAESLGDKPQLEEVVDVYMKVCSCYTEESQEDLRRAVEQTVDALLEQPCQDNTANVVNTILVHLGLIKSEDKEFRPAQEVGGPLLALRHAVRQPYFSRTTVDILTTFLTKSNPILDNNTALRHKLLETVHSL